MVLSLTLFHTTPPKSIIKPTVSTCYGDNPCKACSNCSACKRCGAGGTCGVCASTTKTVRTINTFAGSSTSKTKTANYLGQCKALTKKRSRCKRSGNGSGFCWQHDQ